VQISPDIAVIEADLPRVLIYAQDSDSVSLLHQLLCKWGYGVSFAENSSAASVILHQDRPPKIVILDMSIDSIDLCRGLRAESRDYYPYVLMIGAKNSKAFGELALHSGADDFLPKPIDDLGLLARLSVAKRILDLQDGLICAREELRVRAIRACY